MLDFFLRYLRAKVRDSILEKHGTSIRYLGSEGLDRQGK